MVHSPGYLIANQNDNTIILNLQKSYLLKHTIKNILPLPPNSSPPAENSTHLPLISTFFPTPSASTSILLLLLFGAFPTDPDGLIADIRIFEVDAELFGGWAVAGVRVRGWQVI